MSGLQIALAIGCVPSLIALIERGVVCIPSGAGAIGNVLSIVIGPLLASGT